MTGDSNDNGWKLPGWTLSIVSGLTIAFVLGGYHLINSFTILKTQVSENKEDRQRQYAALERRMEIEIEDLESQIEELEEELRRQTKESDR